MPARRYVPSPLGRRIRTDMSILQSLLRQTADTTAILTKMKQRAAGWDCHKVNPEHLTGPMAYLYTYDRPTGWTWMCAIPVDTFQQLTQAAKADAKSWPAVRGGLAYVLQSSANGTPVPEAEGLDWEAQLGCLLAAYAGTTKVLDVAAGMPNGGHFIVLNYRRARSQPEAEGLLRPAALPEKATGPLTYQEFMGRVEQIAGIDQGRHPEWFC